MKIAITSDLYYPMINGVAVFSHNLALGLAKRGHEVMVICPSFNGKHHETMKDGVKTVYLKSMRFPFYPDQIHDVPEQKTVLGVKMPRLAYKNGIWVARTPYPEIKKALGEFQPDIIHNQMVVTIALAVTRYAHRYGIPLVTTGHAYPDNVTGQLKWLRPMKRPADAVVRSYFASFLKASDYATAPTETAAGDLVPGRKENLRVQIEALSNGIDLSQFRSGKPDTKVLKKYGISAEKPRVLYVGRVDPEKSIGTVVEAFSLALKKQPEAELLVVGDGTDKVRLEELAEEKGILDKVKFLGRVMPPELMEVYKSGTLFATASETETQGIVLIEAAATGLPLVAVDAGAVKELCQNKKNGVLCRPGDAREMAAAMVKILSDKNLRNEYSEESLKIAKMHDINRTLTRFEEIYQEAIALSTFPENV